MFSNYKLLLVINFVLLLNTINCEASEFKIVQISDGKIRGQKFQTLIEKNEFYSFEGIPYAKAPIGELRFKVNFIINLK